MTTTQDRTQLSLSEESRPLLDRVKALSMETGVPIAKIIWASVNHCLPFMEAQKDRREMEIGASKIKL
jgi:hypothetical protein